MRRLKPSAFFAVSLSLVLLFASLFTGCQKEPVYQKFIFYDLESLDTVSNVQIFLTEDQDKDYYQAWFHETLGHYHQLFDAYHSYAGVNNIYTINENAGIQPVVVEKELYDLVAFCLEQREYTLDRTNIAFGTVTSLWKDYMNRVTEERAAATKENRQPQEIPFPKEDDLLLAADHIDMECIQLDPAAQTIYLTDPQARLDVGAVAKGYIAQLLADQMKDMGVASAIINLGGNTKVIGNRKIGEGPSYFLCDIENPDGGSLGFHIRMKDQATLVTSGNYQRFVEVDGIRYHHLIDPDTLSPAQGYRSVTILADDSGLADYLSTALFTVDMETGKQIAQHYGVEVFWITSDLQYDYTPGFPDHIDVWPEQIPAP